MRLSVHILLLAATAAAALRTPIAAPAFRQLSHPCRAAAIRLADDISLTDEAEAPVQTTPSTLNTQELQGVVVPTTKAPATTASVNVLRNGAFVALALAAALFAFKGSVAATATTVGAQVAYEFTHCTASYAKLFGFIGACCNWFLGASALYDASNQGPEVISLPMTLVMLAYSIIFCRWAGWAVMPRNFILAGSHMLNIGAQGNQLRRCLQYKLDTQPNARAEITKLGVKGAGALASVAAFIAAAPFLKALAPVGSWLASSGGPFTIHPWPPVTKFFLSLTSLTDLHRPVDKISLTQYGALTLTGFIFTFYGLFVTPINYALTGVNILLFGSSGWHLARKLNSCLFAGECSVDERKPVWG